MTQRAPSEREARAAKMKRSTTDYIASRLRPVVRVGPLHRHHAPGALHWQRPMLPNFYYIPIILAAVIFGIGRDLRRDSRRLPDMAYMPRPRWDPTVRPRLSSAFGVLHHQKPYRGSRNGPAARPEFSHCSRSLRR